ncbi:DMT family transporter [Thalassotalea euphylliae]|uniref:DMT family transporter n=1 Tax=Thalassotalea euphylliae TaxID=1655234 RepID=UPI003624EC6C
MSANSRSHFLILHSSVLLFALAGLFAKWIALSAYWLVMGRTGFAALALICFIALSAKHTFKIESHHLSRFALTGGLLLLHWLSFFYAIQQSTVAFGLLVFAAFPIFTLAINAYVLKRMPDKASIMQGGLICIGILLLTIDKPLLTSATALISGLFSAFTFALLLAVNKSLVQQYHSSQVALYQNGFAFLLGLPFVLVFPTSVELLVAELPLLVLLGVVFTALAHSALNRSLTQLTTLTVSLAICLEPVYGTIAAMLLLDEAVSWSMLAGGVLIIAVNIVRAVSPANRKSLAIARE